MIAPNIAFDLVHVGKCAGGSIRAELNARGFRFEHFHMRRPVFGTERRYVVLVRDPVARVVSAFNWRRHRLSADLLPEVHTKDPMTQLWQRTEWEFLSQFKDVNDFAERLVRSIRHDVPPIVRLMQLVGHVPQGFGWYLDELLDRIDPAQLAGVIAMERLADDCEAVFGFRPQALRHRHSISWSTHLSAAGRANLVREFGQEYRTLQRLADLADRAGVRMSMTYSP